MSLPIRNHTGADRETLLRSGGDFLSRVKEYIRTVSQQETVTQTFSSHKGERISLFAQIHSSLNRLFHRSSTIKQKWGFAATDKSELKEQRQGKLGADVKEEQRGGAEMETKKRSSEKTFNVFLLSIVNKCCDWCFCICVFLWLDGGSSCVISCGNLLYGDEMSQYILVNHNRPFCLV